MVEGTRSPQLDEAFTTIRGETNSLKEEQGRQGALIEEVPQQLNHLVSNLVQLTARQNVGEGTSNNGRGNTNPLWEGPTGNQVRTL